MKTSIKATKQQLVRIKLVVLILMLGIGWLALDGHIIKALAAAGLLMALLGGWLVAWAPAIWREYQVSYKKLPKAQRTMWNEPSKIYFQVNRYVIAPMLTVLGLLLIWLAFVLHALH